MAISPDKNKTFESGNYTVNGIEFLTKDDTGRPIFKMKDTKRGPQLMATYKTMYNGDDGPVGSLFTNSLATFALAFGIDPATIDADDVYILADLESRINDAQKETKIWVNKSGYIGRLYGASLPEGHYIFSKTRISSRDSEGNPTWRSTNYGDSLIISLMVESNADGSETPYAGVETQLWAGRSGLDMWRALMPDVFDAMFGSEEDELARMCEYIFNEGYNVVGRVGAVNDAGKIGLVKSSLRPIKAGDTVDMQTAATVPSMDVEKEDAVPEHVQRLYAAIQAGCGEMDAFDKYGNLSAAGKTWCRQNLRPIANKYDPPLTAHFDEMTPETVDTYLVDLTPKDTYEEEPF